MSAPTMPRKRVALVIGAGSVKCAAALGLWKVLKREGIAVDMVVGCSGGSLYAAAMALGYDAEETEAMTLSMWNRKVTERRDYGSLLSAFLPKLFKFAGHFGMVHGEPLIEALRKPFGEKTFADTMLPLYITATELALGAAGDALVGPHPRRGAGEHRHPVHLVAVGGGREAHARRLPVRAASGGRRDQGRRRRDPRDGVREPVSAPDPLRDELRVPREQHLHEQPVPRELLLPQPRAPRRHPSDRAGVRRAA